LQNVDVKCVAEWARSNGMGLAIHVVAVLEADVLGRERDAHEDTTFDLSDGCLLGAADRFGGGAWGVDFHGEENGISAGSPG
jgi:hypothetical protein